MPVVELPGDHDMPRVQAGEFGASERFAVTPGLESQGYMHIAGGQSGHPLSPYYRAGFKEWADGVCFDRDPGNFWSDGRDLSRTSLGLVRAQ